MIERLNLPEQRGPIPEPILEALHGVFGAGAVIAQTEHGAIPLEQWSRGVEKGSTEGGDGFWGGGGR